MDRAQLLELLELERFGAPVREWHNGPDTPTALALRQIEADQAAAAG